MFDCGVGFRARVAERRGRALGRLPNFPGPESMQEQQPMATAAKQRRAEHARQAARDLEDTADILRQVGAGDGHVDPRRGDVSLTLAALVEACGRHYRDLPIEVAAQAIQVADAVDRATGSRRHMASSPHA
jgi:hypothetical protein